MKKVEFISLNAILKNMLILLKNSIKVLQNFHQYNVIYYQRLNLSIQDINIEEDLKILSDKNKFLYENNIRFPREEFLNYDIYRRNSEALNSTSLNSTTVSSETISSPKIMRSDSDDFEIISTEQYSESYQNRIINDLLKNIYQEKEIATDEIGKIIDLIQGNLNVAQLLIDAIIFKEKKNLYIKFSNKKNLDHFANILNTISLKIDDVDNEFFDLNFAIIYIAERTFYTKDKINKLYLCALLSKNKIYSTRKFWLDLIDIKINRKIDDQIKNFNGISILNIEKTKINNNSDFYSFSKTKNAISNITDKFKNFFNQKDKPSPKTPTSKNSASYLVIEKIKIHEATTILNECIPHFANFNFAVSEAIDIIVELGTK